MGCGRHSKTGGGGKRLKKPKAWQHTEPITSEQLAQMRDEFWDTIHYYGGHKEIWDALRAAAEADDLEFAKSIVEGAGIIVVSNDLSKCYDETGALYELPNFVLSEPTNLIRNRQPDSQPEGQSSNQPVLSERTELIQGSKSDKQPDNQPEGQSSNQPVMSETTKPNRQPDSQPEGQSSNQPVLSEQTKLIQVSESDKHQPVTSETTKPNRQPDSQPEGQSSNQPVLSELTKLIQGSESDKQPDNQPEGQSSNQPVTSETTKPNRQPDSQPEEASLAINQF